MTTATATKAKPRGRPPKAPAEPSATSRLASAREALDGLRTKRTRMVSACISLQAEIGNRQRSAALGTVEYPEVERRQGQERLKALQEQIESADAEAKAIEQVIGELEPAAMIETAKGLEPDLTEAARRGMEHYRKFVKSWNTAVLELSGLVGAFAEYDALAHQRIEYFRKGGVAPSKPPESFRLNLRLLFQEIGLPVPLQFGRGMKLLRPVSREAERQIVR